MKFLYEEKNTKKTIEYEFNKNWIESSITIKAINFAKAFGDFISPDNQKDKNYITTSQFRTVYGELKRIQMKKFKDNKTSFLLLKPKMAYLLKRNVNKNNKDAYNKFHDFFNQMYDLVLEGGENEEIKRFNNMMEILEATLAYHKSFGGK